MKKAIILYILLLVTVTGCIKENLDDCETTLYFSYLGDGTKEIFPQKIEKVDMYIYNQNNVFVQKTVLNRKELNRQRGTTLNLPSGQYHIICWGNSLNDTRINEGSSLQNNLVGAPHYFTKELISTNDSLYFGEREITIVNESYKVDTVYFSSAQPERAQPPTRHYLEFAKRSISHYMLGKLPQRHTDKRRFILAKQPCRSPALFYERVDIDQ